MRVQKVVNTLEKWSPHGLCPGTLIKRNSDPKKTIGCAVGCLSTEVIVNSKQLQNDLSYDDEYSASDVVDTYLKNNTGISDLLEGAVCDFYELTSDDIASIMKYNDDCLDRDEDDDDDDYNLPKAVRKVIKKLRLKYKTYRRKMKKGDW